MTPRALWKQWRMSLLCLGILAPSGQVLRLFSGHISCAFASMQRLIFSLHGNKVFELTTVLSTECPIIVLIRMTAAKRPPLAFILWCRCADKRLHHLALGYGIDTWNSTATPRPEMFRYTLASGCKVKHLIVHEALRSLPLSQQYPRRQQRLRLDFRRPNNPSNGSRSLRKHAGSRTRTRSRRVSEKLRLAILVHKLAIVCYYKCTGGEKVDISLEQYWHFVVSTLRGVEG